MTKEQILERIKQLELQKQQATSQVILFEGALQDNRFWLDSLESKSEDKDPEVNNG